jgi:hypothetical protein
MDAASRPESALPAHRSKWRMTMTLGIRRSGRLGVVKAPQACGHIPQVPDGFVQN